MVGRMVDTIGRTGGGGARGKSSMVGNATNFVRGFLGGNKKGGRRRR
jgi:hypothetical protein